MLNFSISKFCKSILIVILVLTFINLVLFYINYYYPGNIAIAHIYSFFDTNSEINLPTFFSSILILLASFLLFIIGTNNKKMNFWYFLGGLFFFASMDEMLQIHENCDMAIRKLIDNNAIVHLYGWVGLWTIILIIMFVIGLKFLFSLPRKTRNLFFLASGIFIAGALVMEVIGGGYETESIYYKILTTVEELLEMGGMLVFIYTFLDYIKTNLSPIKIKLEK